MSNLEVLKAAITSTLDVLPVASLETLAEFASFLRDKRRQESTAKPRIVKLRGLWSTTPPITEDDIAEARREMWGNLGNREI
jgi:hypothetical protein